MNNEERHSVEFTARTDAEEDDDSRDDLDKEDEEQAE